MFVQGETGTNCLDIQAVAEADSMLSTKEHGREKKEIILVIDHISF